MDRGLPYQQDLSDLGLGVLIVRGAFPNRMVDLEPLVDTIQRALAGSRSGPGTNGRRVTFTKSALLTGISIAMDDRGDRRLLAASLDVGA